MTVGPGWTQDSRCVEALLFADPGQSCYGGSPSTSRCRRPGQAHHRARGRASQGGGCASEGRNQSLIPTCIRRARTHGSRATAFRKCAYGTIDRGNAEARQLVLSLSEVFRYLLRTDRTFIEIEEELKIVRAYLEIEKLRLGPKLRTEIQIDDAALHATIPMLSIQPLVENAVKHGIAPRRGTGFVRLSVTAEGGAISVMVSNSGEFDTTVLTCR